MVSKRRYAEDPQVRAAVAASHDKYRRSVKTNAEKWVRWWITRQRWLHKRAGVPFDLVPEDLLPVPELCPVLGVPFVLSERGYGPYSLSVDKLRPQLGYTRGNVRVISWRANVMKHDSVDPEELRKVADYMERELYEKL